jgi:C_GCAxxG_C_C family probable redox protein
MGMMMSRVENALNTFENGYNCAQAVFSAYGPECGIDRGTAIKLAAPFGGGMGALGEVCGAVSGALMVLGLRYGNIDIADRESKEKPYQMAREFVEKFREKNGSLLCRDLIRIDISTPEGIEKAREENVFSEICPNFVQEAVKILEVLLK